MKLNALLIFRLHSCFLLKKFIFVLGNHDYYSSNYSSVVNFLKENWIVFQANIGDYWFGSDTDRAYRYDGKTIVHFSASEPLYGRRVFC